MRAVLVICILLFSIVNHAQIINNNTGKVDYEALVSNNIKALRIAKSKKDTVVIKKILKEINENQRLFDTLIIAQINDYLNYTKTYCANLDSNEIKVIYSNNKLNNELNNHLTGILKRDTNKAKEINLLLGIGQNIIAQYYKNDEANQLNFLSDNRTFYLLKGVIYVYDKNNTMIVRKTFEVKPNATFNIDNVIGDNFYKIFYVIIAYKYISIDNKEYYIYKRTENYANKFSLNISSEVSIVKNENKSMSNEIKKMFNFR